MPRVDEIYQKSHAVFNLKDAQLAYERRTIPLQDRSQVRLDGLSTPHADILAAREEHHKKIDGTKDPYKNYWKGNRAVNDQYR